MCLEQSHGAVCRAVCRKPASPAAVLRAALLPAPEQAAEGCSPWLCLAPSEGFSPSPPESPRCALVLLGKLYWFLDMEENSL